MQRLFPLLRAGLLAALLLPAARAVQTESQVFEGYGAWERGELDSLSLHWNGALTAGPRLRDHGAPEAGAIVWDLAASEAGGPVYASTGGPAAVYRYDPPGAEDGNPAEAAGEPSTGTWSRVFSSPAPLVRALHLGGDGVLWIGTSPDGRLYRIASPGASPEVFASLPVDYLWEIREDPAHEGHLLVATGAPGRILRIDPGEPEAEPEVVAETASTHVFTFAHGTGGTLYFATGPNGHLLRQGPGELQVRTLAELGAGEVRGLFPAADGSVRIAVYRGEAGSGNGGPGGTGAGGSGSPSGPSNGNGGGGSAPAPQGPRGLPSGLFSIDAGGFIHPLLVASGEEQVLAATLWRDRILLGSDRRARLYNFEDRYDWSLIAEGREGGEISALASPGAEGVWVASSNPARLYRVRPASGTTPGQYTSDVFDAGHKVRWGRLHATGRQLGDLAVETRSGNRADPDSSWSAWTPLAAGRIASPPGRFLQFRLRLGPEDAVLRRAEVFYQLPNEAPVFRRIRSLPVRLERLPSPPPSKQRTGLAQLFQNNGGGNHGNGSGANGPGGPPVVVHEERGWLSVLWEASDPNGDELRYDLYLRRLGEEDWTLLARDLAEPFHSQQVSGFPAGHYEPRVVASDRRSNLPGTGLTSEKQGALVLLDPEDPVLQGPEADHPRRIRATDGHSRIVSLTFRIDGGEPRPLLPVDGLFDSREESFRLPEDLGPAGTPLLLETEDAAGNRAAWSGHLPD